MSSQQTELDTVFAYFSENLMKPWKIFLECSNHLHYMMIQDFANRWDSLVEQENLKLRSSLLLAVIGIPKKVLRTAEMKKAMKILFEKIENDPSDYVKALLKMVHQLQDDTGGVLDLNVNQILPRLGRTVELLGLKCLFYN